MPISTLLIPLFSPFVISLCVAPPSQLGPAQVGLQNRTARALDIVWTGTGSNGGRDDVEYEISYQAFGSSIWVGSSKFVATKSFHFLFRSIKFLYQRHFVSVCPANLESFLGKAVCWLLKTKCVKVSTIVVYLGTALITPLMLGPPLRVLPLQGPFHVILSFF